MYPRAEIAKHTIFHAQRKTKTIRIEDNIQEHENLEEKRARGPNDALKREDTIRCESMCLYDETVGRANDLSL